MGYDVHITHAESWLDSEARPISLEEWLTYVRSDAEMRHDGMAEATTTAGDYIRIECDGLSVWTAWSKNGVDGSMAWFTWRHRYIDVKNPDHAILEKMRSFAKHFAAYVIADEGERY